MATDLMRAGLKDLYRATRSAHPGLLVQRGLERYDEDDSAVKSDHVDRICNAPVSDFYKHGYRRWVFATSNAMRFRALTFKLDTRLFAGLNGGGMLETGCAIGHSHGAPYIPGSSVKGIVRSHAEGTLFAREHEAVIGELFGAAPSERNPLGLSGLVTFHDAWWIPGSAPGQNKDKPLVREVVTTHHPDYYAKEGARAATDLDSPIPNEQIAVHGSFLFVLEGEPAWTALAEKMLVSALAERGIGAKTRSGYGYLHKDAKAEGRFEEQRASAIAERERAELERKEQEEAENNRKKYEALSDEGKWLFDVEKAVEEFLASGEVQTKQARAELIGNLNKLVAEGRDWTRREDRDAAAKLLEATYDKIGWADPGQKKDKRQKQEEKRRRAVASVRGGEVGPVR